MQHHFKSDAILFPSNKNDVNSNKTNVLYRIQQTIVGDTNFIISFPWKKNVSAEKYTLAIALLVRLSRFS